MSVMGGPGLTSAQVAARLHPGYPAPSGGWFTSAYTVGAINAAGTIYLYWYPIYRPLTVTLLRTRCTTGGAGSAVKFAMWLNDPVTARPVGLPVIGQNAGLATDTSGTWQDLVVPSTVLNAPAGVWFGTKATGTMPQMVSNSATLSGADGRFPPGGMPALPVGNLFIADAYANDIMALDLTGATLGGTTSNAPAFALEWV